MKFRLVRSLMLVTAVLLTGYFSLEHRAGDLEAARERLARLPDSAQAVAAALAADSSAPGARAVAFARDSAGARVTLVTPGVPDTVVIRVTHSGRARRDSAQR